MRREWLGIFVVFSSILTVLTLISPVRSATVQTGATESAANLTVPTATTPKKWQCIGPISPNMAQAQPMGWMLCAPGSQSFDNKSVCNNGMIGVGQEFSAGTWSAAVNCQAWCAPASLTAASCGWY